VVLLVSALEEFLQKAELLLEFSGGNPSLTAESTILMWTSKKALHKKALPDFRSDSNPRKQGVGQRWYIYLESFPPVGRPRDVQDWLRAELGIWVIDPNAIPALEESALQRDFHNLQA